MPRGGESLREMHQLYFENWMAPRPRRKGRLSESSLRGSAGVPLTCLAGRTLLLYRHPPCLCVSLLYYG
nr:MAG TPA: hypothetical protein [Caudoviricetes sp.]